jgi:ATP-dependent RNA helicase DeaD
VRTDSEEIADSSSPTTFADLALSEPVLQAVQAAGYEAPSSIQAATIPELLAGKDVLGQAQTGAGKTAAFALPILTRIDVERRVIQALVLTPTRELAIQVAEAFQRYASKLPGFHVLPIYGGQSYTPQLQGLRRGAHVVVGTPGRVLDHMKRGALDLSSLRFLVLDEADEMLQMGFIEDVEWVLEHTPPQRTIALFSATMPGPIRRIAQKHLRASAQITIESRTTTAANIHQRYWLVSGMHKLDALTRILETEAFDGMLIFTRTKQSTVELAERLQARGFSAEPLNGDIPQAHRERTIARLRSGQVDIVVATDVAARGLDVERISHVINFDVPYDSESYVHRVGRTGRAGRSGEAILFISPRERNMLRIIERATRQQIERMELPSVADVNVKRTERFKQRITDALATAEAQALQPLIEQYEREHDVPAIEIAAALASIVQGGKPLFLPERKDHAEARAPEHAERSLHRKRAGESSQAVELHEEAPIPASAGAPRHIVDDRRAGGGKPKRPERRNAPQSTARHERQPPRRRTPEPDAQDSQTERYRIEVGRMHGAAPANIVGAIANEAGIEGRYIGRIEIHEDHSFVDLPLGMPKEIFRHLQKVRVAGQQLQIGRARKPPATEQRTHGPRARGVGSISRARPAARVKRRNG